MLNYNYVIIITFHKINLCIIIPVICVYARGLYQNFEQILIPSKHRYSPEKT